MPLIYTPDRVCDPPLSEHASSQKEHPINQAASDNPNTHVVSIHALTHSIDDHAWTNFNHSSSRPQAVVNNLNTSDEAGTNNHHAFTHRDSDSHVSYNCCCLTCFSAKKKTHSECFRITWHSYGWYSLPSRLHCECPALTVLRQHVANENLLILNLIQFLCGLSAIILTSVAMTKTVFLYQVGTGMWAGLIMMITGTQGLLIARRPVFCTLIGLLVMCLISSIAACFLIGVSVAGTIEDGFLDSSRRYPPSSKSPDIFKFTLPVGPFNRFPHFQHWRNRTHALNLHPHMVGNEINVLGMQPFISDSYLRTCRVILHVLLLLIGILESSIGLSTVVLCCRYVCSRSAQRRLTGTSGAHPQTRIVSFDANTATQAANLLQSGYMDRLASAGSVLLAVGTDTLLERDQQYIQAVDSSNPDVFKPHIHDMVHAFLPQSIDNSSALILTQAGTGALAWTAARAAAFAVRDSNPRNEDLSISSQTEPSSPQPSSTGFNNGGLNSRSKPKLLFTPVSAPPVSHPSTMPTDCYDVTASCPPGSTFLYVMPSPSPGEPPMIFPPFPPTYSEQQRRPYMATSFRPNTSTTDASFVRRPPSYSQFAVDQRSVQSGRRATANGRLRILRSLHSGRRWIRHLRRSSPTRRSRRPSTYMRPSATSLLCAIDRLLQPVVIIGTPDSSTNPIPSDPPEYLATEESVITT